MKNKKAITELQKSSLFIVLGKNPNWKKTKQNKKHCKSAVKK